MRNHKRFWIGSWRALALLLVLLTPGCCTNLNASFVRQARDTRLAIEADVEAGLYKPDKHSLKTLAGYAKAEADAIEVLKREDKWPAEWDAK